MSWRASRGRLAAAVMLAWSLGAGAAGADAPPHRYTVADGTVRDSQTKLTWQAEADSTRRTWADAIAYCAELGLAGGGWRLPTLKELLTLVDPARTVAPAIDPGAFPSAPADLFWSSNSYIMDDAYGWTVDFEYGNSARDHAKATPAYARCVR